MRTILIASVFVTLAHAGCVAVSSDRILAGDISAALPFLQGLDPQTPIGFSPRPGVQRILSARELTLIARKNGVHSGDIAVPSICVERVVRPISLEEMKAALLSAIGAKDAELELLEFSKEPLPPGQLEFKPAGLARPQAGNPENPVIWRGSLHYDRLSSAPVWAKVKVSVGCAFLAAAEDIPAGTVITAAQVKEIAGRQFPFLMSPIQSPQAVVGKIAHRTIPAGQRFEPGALDEPTEISRGDTVRVVVVDGSAMLSLDAIAQSSGKKGESILLHNPASGKSFRAIVEERGRATVRPSPGV